MSSRGLCEGGAGAVQRRPIDILVVDDHELVRVGLKEQLGSEGDLRVVGEAASSAEAIRLAIGLKPDVMLVDMNLGDGSGVDVCRRMRDDCPTTRILILTICDEDSAVQAAIAAGAQGYLLKDVRQDLLLQAVRTVAAGASFIDSRLIPAVFNGIRRNAGAVPTKALAALSPQERRVLPLLAEGKTNKEIGVVLGLSEKTVKNYLANMFEKLKITRRTQAAAFYVRSQQKSGLPDMVRSA